MREFTVPATITIPDDATLGDTAYDNAKNYPDTVSFSRRVDGRWEDVTAARFADEVTAVAKGLIANGMFAYTRNPNFLGEIMIYATYAILAASIFGWIFVLLQWFLLFLPRMLVKDASISRHPDWAEYKARSGLLIPWRILSGRAFFDK